MSVGEKSAYAQNGQLYSGLTFREHLIAELAKGKAASASGDNASFVAKWAIKCADAIVEILDKEARDASEKSG